MKIPVISTSRFCYLLIDKYLHFDYLSTNNILSTLLCLILSLKQTNKSDILMVVDPWSSPDYYPNS